MTESAAKLEGYLAVMRATLKTRVLDGGFVGNVAFEVNIKHGDITNMNIDTRESVRI